MHELKLHSNKKTIKNIIVNNQKIISYYLVNVIIFISYAKSVNNVIKKIKI
jgi:hypothetical protein